MALVHLIVEVFGWGFLILIVCGAVDYFYSSWRARIIDDAYHEAFLRRTERREMKRLLREAGSK